MAEAFTASKGRYGYRRIRAVLRTLVSEKVIRRIMKEDGLTMHVPKRRRYSSYEGETTPAPGNLADRDFTAEAPNEKWPGWLALIDRYGLTRPTGTKGVYGQINVYGVTTKSERHKRSYWTRTADGNGIGGRKAPVPYGS